MRRLLPVPFALLLTCFACSSKSEEKPVTHDEPETIALPPSVAAKDVLGKSRSDVRASLGKPVEADEREDEFAFGPVSMTVTYGHDTAVRLLVMAKSVPSGEVARWLGVQAGQLTVADRRYLVKPWPNDPGDELLGTVTVDLAELPREAPPIEKLLGGNKATSKRLMKDWEEMTPFYFIDRDDDLTVNILFDDKRTTNAKAGDVRYVSIAFREGVVAKDRLDEILAWLKLDPDENGIVTVKRRKFMVTADALSVMIERRYI